MVAIPKSRQASARAGPSGEDISRLPPSYYASTAGSPVVAPPLDGDAAADFCIIGGGFAGLGAALALARLGHSVRLIEMGPIGWGASGRNGGQVHVGWQQDQPWLERAVGKPAARALWQAALDARMHLDTLLALAPDACDFRPGLIHADHRAAAVAATHAHVQMMRRDYDYDSLTPLSRDQLRAMLGTDAYHGGSFDTRGGHLHPLKLAWAMARSAQGHGAVLHAGTWCSGLARTNNAQATGGKIRHRWRVTTPRGIILADKVLDATGAYARALVPQSDAHILPVNNYIATTQPLAPGLAHSLIANGAAVSDGRFVVYYFRLTPDRRLLFGGGETYGYRMPNDIAAFVRPHILRIFPQLANVAISHAWGGTLAISPNRLPYVIEPCAGLYALNGFSGVGVVLGPWLGELVGRAMAEQRDSAYDLFRRLPGPRFPGGPWLRWPTQALAMRAMALRDRF